MAFRAALVAFAEDAAYAPFLGHQFTEIVLQQPNGEDAANPGPISYVSRDKILEGTTGQDTAVDKRKLVELTMNLDFVDTATKQKIERLYQNGRVIYFCPNVGPSTRWSLPLQRGLADFTGRKTVSTTRNGTAYFWDEVDKVFRSWQQYDPAIAINGRWSRYLTGQEGHQNKASYPHPTSTNHGWSTLVGTATFTYTEDVLSPVLQQRTVTNQKGVVLVHCASGLAVVMKHDSAATLSTTNSVTASVCMAWQGTARFDLTPTAGGSAIDTVTIDGDGTFKLVKLGGPNTTAANQYRVIVYLLDAASKKQAAILGPTHIASTYSAEALPGGEDWNAGVVATDVVYATDTVDHALTDFTFSAFIRWTEYPTGILLLGTGWPFQFSKTAYDALVVAYTGAGSPATFANVQASLGVANGWAVGDWVHIVLRGSDSGGLALFVNGKPHADNGVDPWEPANYDYAFRIAFFTPSGGVSHARMDAVAWTDQEIVDHYHTYFSDRGMGIVEPAFGKAMQITDLEFTGMAAGGEMQWRGPLVLTELGPDDDFAGMVRQEGDV